MGNQNPTQLDRWATFCGRFSRDDPDTRSWAWCRVPLAIKLVCRHRADISLSEAKPNRWSSQAYLAPRKKCFTSVAFLPVLPWVAPWRLVCKTGCLIQVHPTASAPGAPCQPSWKTPKHRPGKFA